MAEIAFFERGDGDKPVVVLHGYLGSGRNLGSFSQRLAELRPDLHIYVCDLPGHGVSAPLPPQPGLRALIEPVAEFIATLSAKAGEAISLIGHSLGGRVALCLADEHPDIVVGAELIDIAPGPIGTRNTDLENVARALAAAPAEAHSRDEMRAFLMAQGLTHALADWLLMNLRNDGGVLRWRVERQALIALGRATRDDDLWPAATRVSRRLACVYGEDSGFVLPADVAHLAELGAVVKGIPGAGHFVHVDALAQLVALSARLIP